MYIEHLLFSYHIYIAKYMCFYLCFLAAWKESFRIYASHP